MQNVFRTRGKYITDKHNYSIFGLELAAGFLQLCKQSSDIEIQILEEVSALVGSPRLTLYSLRSARQESSQRQHTVQLCVECTQACDPCHRLNAGCPAFSCKT